MPVRYDEDQLISALPYARGDDRTVLVGALGGVRGSRGPAVLRQLVVPESGEGGYTRAMAIHALAQRTGAQDTPLYAEALRDRSVPVQLAAADVLAECGDRRASEQMLAWLRRKLRRKARQNTLDPAEVPSAIRFAERNGLLREVAQILTEDVAMLDSEEREWLAETWPDVAQGDVPAEGHLAAPDAARLNQALYGDYRDEADPEEAGMRDGFIQEALTRAQKRAARTPSV